MTTRFELPPHYKPNYNAGYLTPEIAGEGERVIMSDGEVRTFRPPPPKPIIPDWSQIKQIAHYFQQKTHIQIYPAWLYHVTGAEPDRLVKNADEAADLGVCFREATQEEFGRYRQHYVWDWMDDSPWRPTPQVRTKFDPQQPGLGKTYIDPLSNPATHQTALLQALVNAMQKANPAAAASELDPDALREFLQFQAWRKQQAPAAPQSEMTASPPTSESALGPTSEDDERAAWEAEAIRKDIKIDGRWSLETLKAKVQEAA